MRERKNGLLMHAPISPTCSLFLLFLFYHLVFFLVFWSSISLSYFFFSPPLLSLSFFLATFHPFYTSQFYGISTSLGLHQPFLVSYGHLSKLAHNPLVARPLPLFRVCLLHHSLVPNKILCFVSPLSSISALPSMDKD